jgi:ureidoglycolate hydrolase
MRTIVCTVLSLILICADSPKISNEKVYVCKSSTSVAYHNNINCYGLKKCTHQIISVTIDEAKNMGKRACKICY